MSKNISFEGPIEGVLPHVPHFFSTLIFMNEGGVEKYYEVNYRFHGTYKSTPRFNRWWQYFVRPTRSAESSLRYRAECVLRRAGVRIVRFKYVASVQFLKRNVGDKRFARAMRHITSVTVSYEDFEFLQSGGMLRLLYEGGREVSRAEKHRQVICGILPLQTRLPAEMKLPIENDAAA